ncbi:MAG: Cof-type HAD-IIB family hydrolase [Marinilabiliaceae bacterium]|nr:Cof-type HAD-IIB family hydrolase [Marinilabiliaceae bacterium]
MSIKAVFFDIDGTLVSFKTHIMPQSTIDALNKLQTAGIRIFIASGRHISTINNLGDQKFDGMITINGGMTIVDGKIIDEHTIPNNEIESIVDYMQTERNFPCCFVEDSGVYINHTNHDTDVIFDMINFPSPASVDMNNLTKARVYQLIAFFRPEEEPTIMRSLPNCRSARWHELFTDIVPNNVSKVTGIEAIAKHYGFNRNEIATFGDGGNDIEMLQWAEMGIAMGNADENVKNHARYVTTAIDDDGIWNAVNNWILK